MQKIFDFIRNLKLPSKKDFLLAFSAFSKKEWVILSVLTFAFLISSFILLHDLNQSFMVKTPLRGGSVTEGIVGTPRFINPVLAFTDVDRDLSALVYSGLLRKDPEGDLIPDLAESYEISEDGRTYTFTLKEKVFFHDGESVSADDILFTISEIKNPVLRSPLSANWDGVEVEKIDDLTVSFRLRGPDASFIENTTVGILPEHLWNGFPLELSDLNINPIGSGAFQIKKMGKSPQGTITSAELVPFKKFALGRPYIKKMDIRFYQNEIDLISALERKEVEHISQISPRNAELLESKGYRVESYILPRIFGIFFNQSENQIFTDKNIISAIDLLVDKNRIVSEVLYGYGKVINGPLPDPLSVNGNYGDTLPRDERITQAEELLTKSGWKKNADGIWQKGKDNQSLSFSISTSNSEDLVRAANIVKEDLDHFGIQVEIKTFESGDLNQTVIRPRKYDALLFGEIVNRQSDLFAFWHSSQRKDPGLNVAMYTNVRVDKILEEALITLDEEVRAEKYSQFEQEIKKEKPAVFLYSPSFIYVVKGNVEGISSENLSSSKDRFLNSHLWYTEVDNIWKIFAKTN
ncbi:MAG TPA: ABC transporter substrate-binding protein [Candidatus Paceibacterota bacterium]|nr:ABC transporter substrate-binding protein [Candidatus Paceibacterota bacterium]